MHRQSVTRKIQTGGCIGTPEGVRVKMSGSTCDAPWAEISSHGKENIDVRCRIYELFHNEKIVDDCHSF